MFGVVKEVHPKFVTGSGYVSFISLCNKQIFLALKIENFQLKNFDIFLNFAQNIVCGYTLEPPR